MRTYENFVLLDEGKQAKLRAARKVARNVASRQDDAKAEQEKFRAARSIRDNKPEIPTAMDKQRAASRNMNKPKGTAVQQELKLTSPAAASKGAEAVKSKTGNTVKPTQPSVRTRMSDSGGAGTQRMRQIELQRRAKQKELEAKKKEHDSKAGDRFDKRRGGVGGGIKSALGGDVIGMKKKSGETEADREYRKAKTSKARAEFAKKKVGQTTNLVKSVPGKVLGAASKAARFAGSSVKDVGSSSGTEGSSAGRMQKQY
jgi:hypothetical protein